MIDALPEAAQITEENAAEVEAQLDAIDEAKSALYQAGGDVDSLDMSRYDAACAALAALSESDETGTLLLGPTPSLTTANGTELTKEGGLLSSGNYYLANDVELENNIHIQNGATVTIDLNGYILTGTGSDSVIKANGTLTLIDDSPAQTGKITGGSAIYGGGVHVGSTGSFTMSGGTITGNSGTYGGGI